MGVYSRAGTWYIILGIFMLLSVIGAIASFIGALLTEIPWLLLVIGVIWILSAIILILTGVFTLPLAGESGVGMFTAAGGLLIIDGILTLVYGILPFIDISLFFSMGMIVSIIGLITFILLGIALMRLGDTTGEGSIRTAGIITLIGAILLIIAVGYIILLIGLIMAGSAVKKLE